MLKTLTAATVAGSMLVSPAMAALPAGAVVDNATKIYYNDVLLETEQPVINQDGRVLLAFRDLFENLDGEVSWDPDTRIASLTYGKTSINLMPDNGAAQINGVPQVLDVGPQIINDRVYLPLRFVAQALGGTVEYSRENGVGEVRIYTIDSVQNFTQQNGKITAVLRTTADPVSSVQPTKETQAAYDNWTNNNAAYFMDGNNNLVEVQSYDSTIQVNVIDLAAAKVTSTTQDAGVLYPVLGDVVKGANGYSVAINSADSDRYIGVGTPITTSKYRDILETRLGDMAAYNGRSTETQLTIDADGKAAVNSVTTEGVTLDMAQLNGTQKYTSYAVADNGTAAYMINGHMLIVDNDNKILEDAALSRNVSYSEVFTTGDKFVAVIVEEGSSYPEVHAAVYKADGTMVRSMRNISNISKVAEDEKFYSYNNLTAKDAAVVDDVLYVLAKTDMDYYLVQFDTNTYEYSKEHFGLKEPIYDGFIYTNDGVKLFGADEDYFYLRDVK